MLTILDTDGNDLTLVRPLPVVYTASNGKAQVSLACVVVEDDSSLTFQAVSADVDWNDGTPAVHYPTTSSTASQASPLELTLRRSLGYGTYAVTVTAQNNRAVPDVTRVTFIVTVKPAQVRAAPARQFFGPILPRDNGSPNRSEWNFDLGEDLLVLESSIRMLLLTAKGERLMLPDYGTNIRRVVFDLSIETVDALIVQEISQAMAIYEPRASVQSVNVTRNSNDRSVKVDALFMSRISGQPFQIDLTLT